MSCPSLQPIRTEMFAELRVIETRFGQSILEKGDIMLYLLGKQCNDVADELNYEFHIHDIACASFISRMYRLGLERRKGIG